jgi:hypothetical protein
MLLPAWRRPPRLRTQTHARPPPPLDTRHRCARRHSLSTQPEVLHPRCHRTAARCRPTHCTHAHHQSRAVANISMPAALRTTAHHAHHQPPNSDVSMHHTRQRKPRALGTREHRARCPGCKQHNSRTRAPSQEGVCVLCTTKLKPRRRPVSPSLHFPPRRSHHPLYRSKHCHLTPPRTSGRCVPPLQGLAARSGTQHCR